MIPTDIRWCIDGRETEGGCKCCQHAYEVRRFGRTIECFGFAKQRDSNSFVINEDIMNYVYESGCVRFKEQATSQKERVNLYGDKSEHEYPEELKEYLEQECGRNI